MLLNCGAGEDSWESLGLCGDPTSPSWRKSVLNIHWKDWCWSWSSNTVATWYEQPAHWKRPWCWERLGAGGEGDDRGWDGWIASLIQWTWTWADSGRQWGTGRPGLPQFVRSQRVGHDLVSKQQKQMGRDWVALKILLALWLFDLWIYLGNESYSYVAPLSEIRKVPICFSFLINSEVKAAQSCPTLCDPMDYTVHGILQAKLLEWVAVPFSRRSSKPRDWTQVFHIGGGFLTSWAIREAQEHWSG